MLSGTAAWRRGDAPAAPIPPGRRITHASFEWHAMETHDEPLLAMWLWTGDIDIGSYRMWPGRLRRKWKPVIIDAPWYNN